MVSRVMAKRRHNVLDCSRPFTVAMVSSVAGIVPNFVELYNHFINMRKA